MNEQPWPMWLKIIFANDPNIEGLECSISCNRQMIDIVDRYNLSSSNTIELRINDFNKTLSKKRIADFYQWIDNKIRVEVEEDEARKKAEEESKNSNDRSGIKPKGMVSN